MDIYLIRHGETNWNKEKRLQGRSDVPLNEYGIQLARITGEALKSIPFDRIYTSPLSRARETARIIAGQRVGPDALWQQEGQGLNIIADERLMEIGFGAGEGISLAELQANPSHPLHKFLHDPGAYAPPAGGESLEELFARSESFLREIILPAEKDCQSLLVVAHGALIRGLIHVAVRRPVSQFWGKLQRNCAVTILGCTEGRFTLKEEGRIFYTEKKGADW